MHITGLDYVTMMVDSLDHTCSTLEAALGLDFGPERRQGGWGTATRAAVFPGGTYLEVMAVTDTTADPTGAAKQRGLHLLRSGDGWKSFGLRTADVVATWSAVRAAGLHITPPVGHFSQHADGSHYRWWVAGHGEEFRNGRLPNLVEYEGDPYPDPTVLGHHTAAGHLLHDIAAIVAVVPDLSAAVDDYTRLLGSLPDSDPAPCPESDSTHAVWTLPDGRQLQLAAPVTQSGPLAEHLATRGPGLRAVTFAVEDTSRAARALTARRLRCHRQSSGCDLVVEGNNLFDRTRILLRGI